jgi:preprotein translocase SecE subunit
MQKLIQYLKGVRSEMAKVSWPKKDEVKNATTLVVIFSIVFAIIVKIFDYALGKVIFFLLNM